MLCQFIAHKLLYNVLVMTDVSLFRSETPVCEWVEQENPIEASFSHEGLIPNSSKPHRKRQVLLSAIDKNTDFFV